MSGAGPQRVLVLTARSRDARLANEFLARAGLQVTAFRSFDALMREVATADVDCVVLVEEAIPRPALASFAQILARQPPWSDLPIILFTSRFGGTTSRSLNGLGANVSLLERPVRVATLMQAVQSALRARRRQYEFRDLLSRMEEADKSKSELLRKLADADRRKDEFLAMLGHELRNPLAAIHNALHVLQHSKVEDVLERQPPIIERQSRHLARLVDDLLDVSRVTMGKINLEQGWVDLNDVAVRCIQALTPLAQEQRHELTVTTPPGVLIVEGDQVRLEQILSNLVNNAIKYTPPGGTIRVVVERDQETGVVRVLDTGIGISPDMLPKIFDLFTQADQALDRSQGGLGLGLSLVKSLVERHNGTIEAHSPGIGRGSEFIVRLPLAAAHASVAAEREERVLKGRRLRIAVIEDNDDARETTVAILEMNDHEVSSAANGEDGLQLVLRERPDIALVDIGLPKLDGYELARQIRAKDSSYALHLVAMTGYGQPDDRRRALEAGFDTHLVKPVRAVDLLRLISQRRIRNSLQSPKEEEDCVDACAGK